MSDADDDGRPLDPDRLDGVAHPRETETALGHEETEAAFLEAFGGGRAHHAWLLRGAPGVGKATVAYRIARFLLSGAGDAGGGGLFGEAAPATSLDVSAEHPAARMVRAGAHPGLVELRRPWNERTKTFRAVIPVESVRRLIEFFQLSAADGGWRVALIDPADELNPAAANALLKLIEEPPPRCVFLLVAHAPGRLPATIRSRCRRLDFRPPPFDLAVRAIQTAAPEVETSEAERLAALVDASPGEALRLRAIGGLGLYAEIVALLATLPTLDRGRLDALSRSAAKKPGADGIDRFRTTARLLRLACERLARQAATGRAPVEAAPGEAAAFRRLGADVAAARLWAEAASEIADRLDAAIGLNLDPVRSILDTALYLEGEARRIA